ncbi:MAG: hypothetical protein KatS3mg076_1823 [Candidatus Binatia bacterium]|nr:MAG: hypothetical protein KatS3mg076_1823 [Candidatus Binatia bacterium]
MRSISSVGLGSKGWGRTSMRRQGKPRASAASFARLANASVTTTTAGTPAASHSIVSWTLHDVHDPHVPRPTTAASTARTNPATFLRSSSVVPTRIPGSKTRMSRTFHRRGASRRRTSEKIWKDRHVASRRIPRTFPPSFPTPGASRFAGGAGGLVGSSTLTVRVAMAPSIAHLGARKEAASRFAGAVLWPSAVCVPWFSTPRTT